MKKMKNLVKKKYGKILMFLFLDILVIFVCSFFALWIRFDFGTIPHLYLNNFNYYLLIDVFIMILVFLLLKLYTSVWSYASIMELINVIIGCFILEGVSFTYHHLFKITLPRSFFLIRLMLMIIFICGIRYSYRIFRSIYIRIINRFKKKNTMIIGAGSAARLLIDEMLNNQMEFNSKIKCIIDDNKELKGTFLRGIPVCGNRQSIGRNVKKYEITEIIIAIPSAVKNEIAKIVSECQKTNCDIKILPSIYLSMSNNKNIIESIRPLNYEDFLGRNQVVVDSNEIIDSIKDKIVLVTGGGGSIGSELCRQVASSNPKILIIFDIYENNAYDIQQELIRNYPNLDLRTVIGSIRDYDRLDEVFKKFKPEIVFHAAAHKHVPLMEVSPNEAIKNNCLGTLNLCKLSNIYKLKKFVLVSTDKAVRPTNIMGASKRICEMIVQTYDKMSQITSYVAVRFGNVLGSNGSVIPLFLKQIENGGPVTVTDKNITRFFMTIPEAVNLILQANCYAKGGEIFVLDMGEPVKIYELAEKLIRFKGYEPGRDIEIKITGLRPGEKLYEERLMEEEGLKQTPNKLISIGKPLDIPKTFLKDLDSLISSAYKNKNDIKQKVQKIVPTYKIDTERIGK